MNLYKQNLQHHNFISSWNLTLQNTDEATVSKHDKHYQNVIKFVKYGDMGLDIKLPIVKNSKKNFC
jgi:hypothetical protein